MKVAFDKVDITPNYSCHMAGYSRVEKSNSVLDPIEINSIALEINNQLFLFSILDSIMVEEDFCNDIKNEIFQLTNDHSDIITISAIHTHSAPAFFKLAFEETIVDYNLQRLAKKEMIHSLIRCKNQLEECTITLEKAYIDGLYGNRNIKGGIEDKSVYLFSFYNKSNQRIGALFNISAHPTILNGNSYALSADLLGHIRLKLQKQLHCSVAITNGCCGDVSTRFYRSLSGIEELEDTSSKIIEQFNAKKVQISLNASPIQFDSVEQFSIYDAKNDADWIQMTNDLESSTHMMTEFFKDRQKRKLNMGIIKLHLISQIRIMGNVIIITLPGDVLSGFGIKIKESFPNHEVIILAYSNAYCNYMVPNEEYGKFFETYNSRLSRNEADKFIDSVINKTQKLLDIPYSNSI